MKLLLKGSFYYNLQKSTGSVAALCRRLFTEYSPNVSEQRSIFEIMKMNILNLF